MLEKTPLISVVVPIYGVEKYLQRCLDSIAQQTYQNLEIILVDDGSVDNSGKIADEYALKDERMLVIHRENGGLSAARNTGIKAAKGEYITFVDSDDYIDEDYVEYMYQLLKKDSFKAKLVVCSLRNVFEQTGKIHGNGNGKECILTGKECLEMMCYHDQFDTCAYAKLGETSLYREHLFPEGMLFEDIGHTYKILLECPRVACGFVDKYSYVMRANSIVQSSFSSKKLDLLTMTDQMAKTVSDVYPDLAKAVLRRQVYARFSTLNQMLDAKNVLQQRKEIVNFLKKHKREVLKDPKTPKRDRLAYLMLALGYPIYRMAWKFYEKKKIS